MTKSKTHNKKGAAAIVTVAVLALIALFGMAACSNAAQSGTGTGGSTALPEAPFVEGGASLILSPDKLDIKVKVTTSDGSSVTVEGCEETTLTSGARTVLHAKGRLVILKGNIKELDFYKNQLTALNVQGLTDLRTLDCWGNQLTELNVQGCTALQELKCGFNKLTALDVQGLTTLQNLFCPFNQLTVLNVQDLTALKELTCHGNRLNAEAFTKLFTDLPQRADSDRANCVLYIEKPGFTDDNHIDFTAPPDLAAAFNNVKTKKRWVMLKMTVDNIGKLHWIGL
ncbi:leucine-rich repeat domain-containing protein [Treponema parvum]|uniref:Leucine-rich repeat domain-containing protein n=1 Tax=Treponema parvum TaxID=138851 RepID=A0A975F620_9SPIR|nr:leucine-rich repeat domain-containing protein [Treponema parvum]QTQ14958.1 leucine-rich repeat domain-containing protein [Treponema parvum]